MARNVAVRPPDHPDRDRLGQITAIGIGDLSVLRRAVLVRMARMTKNRRRGAQKGAAIRAHQRVLEAQRVALGIWDGQWPSGPSCVVCGRPLSTPASQARHIGDDCWPQVQAALGAIADVLGAPVSLISKEPS
jgi:hypothetical protein